MPWQFLVGPSSYAEAVPRLFAWAEADVHEGTYDDAEHDEYEAECSIWNERGQFFRETFDEWRVSRLSQVICSYANAAGELDYFRIELTLDELGEAFLIVDQFATTGVRQLTMQGPS